MKVPKARMSLYFSCMAERIRMTVGLEVYLQLEYPKSFNGLFRFDDELCVVQYCVGEITEILPKFIGSWVDRRLQQLFQRIRLG